MQIAASSLSDPTIGHSLLSLSSISLFNGHNLETYFPTRYQVETLEFVFLSFNKQFPDSLKKNFFSIRYHFGSQKPMWRWLLWQYLNDLGA
jgi:hypothetical protein